ncbi:hypothetical protein [Kitasatospora sp. NPDC051914]|uniref:hypothetical protein n=1 Tax=Kitasatospora sp. NPDC051914 TaxID=3154945 RepID=UPI0034203546
MGSTRALLEARLPAVREERTRLEEELAAVIAQENAMVAVLEGLAALSDAPLGEAEDAQAVLPVQPADEAPAAAGELAESVEPVEAAAPVETAVADEQAPAVVKKTAAKKTTKKATAKKAVAKKTAPRKAAVGKGRAAKKSAAPSATQQDAEQEPAAVKKTARSAARTTGPGPVRAKTATPVAARKSTRAKTAPAAVDQAQEPSKGRRRRTDADSVLGVLRQAEEPLRARDVADRLGLADTNGAVDAVRTMLERLAKASRAKRTGRGLYAVAD